MLKCLKSRWQNFIENKLEEKNGLFKKTFEPYIENLEVFLEELKIHTKIKRLNMKKVAICIDDIKFLEAYNTKETAKEIKLFLK